MPSDGDIEAIARPFAIEHTSIDSIKNQRLYEAHFKPLSQYLSQIDIVTPARIKLILSLEDFSRSNHTKLKIALIKWIQTEVSRLPDGHSEGDTIVDVLVRWRCWKYSDRPPGLLPWAISRY